MNFEKKSFVATICLSLVALVWGTSYAITKELLAVVEPFTLMSIRFVGAVAILSLIYIGRILKMSKKDFMAGAIIGLTMFGAFFNLIMGIQYTAVSKQTFLIGSFVIMVPFLRWLINSKKPHIYSIVGAFSAFLGLAMLTLGGIEGINKGDIYSLFCAFFFSLHMVALEKYCGDSDTILLSILQFLVTAVIFLFLSYEFENFDFSVVISHKFPIFYLVVVSTVIGFVTQTVAQRYISSTSVALILTLESVFGSIFAVYYLKETMSSTMIIGCFVIFIGIITQETKWKFLKLKGSKNGNYKK